MYAEIPVETIRFLDSISNKLDVFVSYDPDITLQDWENGYNYGEDRKSGLKKIEDPYFIVYFRDDTLQAERAVRVLQWANASIPPSEELLGRYPYPEEVNNRKVAVYLADSKPHYSKLAEILHGKPVDDIHRTAGVYFSVYSRIGHLTKGILLSPEIWRSDTYAQEVLRHEMNHYVYFTLIEYDKVVRPYMWVYEGLAEYFSRDSTLGLTEEQIRLCRSFTLSATFPDYVSNYWAGESVYRFMESVYGKDDVKAFIMHTYSNTIDNASSSVFGKNLGRIEGEWKQWLQK
jgi:hypothetical protein